MMSFMPRPLVNSFVTELDANLAVRAAKPSICRHGGPLSVWKERTLQRGSSLEPALLKKAAICSFC